MGSLMVEAEKNPLFHEINKAMGNAGLLRGVFVKPGMRILDVTDGDDSFVRGAISLGAKARGVRLDDLADFANEQENLNAFDVVRVERPALRAPHLACVASLLSDGGYIAFCGRPPGG